MSDARYHNVEKYPGMPANGLAYPTAMADPVSLSTITGAARELRENFKSFFDLRQGTPYPHDIGPAQVGLGYPEPTLKRLATPTGGPNGPCLFFDNDGDSTDKATEIRWDMTNSQMGFTDVHASGRASVFIRFNSQATDIRDRCLWSWDGDEEFVYLEYGAPVWDTLYLHIGSKTLTINYPFGNGNGWGWHDVLVAHWPSVFAANTKVYCDGVYRGQASFASQFWGGNGTFTIGGRDDERRYSWAGEIDCCAVWNERLEAEHAEALHRDPFQLVQPWHIAEEPGVIDFDHGTSRRVDFEEGTRRRIDFDEGTCRRIDFDAGVTRGTG